MLTIQGRPALLWSLVHPDGSHLECVGGTVADGTFGVQVLRNGHPHDGATFSTEIEVVRWAETIEQRLKDEGACAP